jgi:glutamine amidotransferase-like uncharacterized protein
MFIKTFFLNCNYEVQEVVLCFTKWKKNNALCVDRGCPSLTYYQRLNRLPDVHKIRYFISLQIMEQGGSFVKICFNEKPYFSEDRK